LLHAYLGHRNAETIEAAASSDARAAEIAFYLGERDRQLGNKAEGDRRLRQAASLLTPLSVEGAMARR
jgi:hypothetical protein